MFATIKKSHIIEPKIENPELFNQTSKVLSQMVLTSNENKIKKVSSFSDVNPAILKFLYNNSNSTFNNAFEFLEQKTNIKRENVCF